MTLTALRARLYEVVDQVLETGVPQIIERRGKRLKIVLDEPRDKFDNLIPHRTIVGDPDDLIDLTVSEWNEASNLGRS